MSNSGDTTGSPEPSKSGEIQENQPGFFMRSTIASFRLKFPTVKNIETSKLYDWIKPSSSRSVLILDARPEEEYAISHIEGAERVDFETENLTELSESIREKLEDKPNPTVVCYCSIGYRSSALASRLQEFQQSSGQDNVPEVYNLAGSLFQWANERRPMVDGEGRPTVYAHPYSAVWGKLLDEPLRKP